MQVTLARKLVAQRGQSFDHALLGDLLMEQGKLKEAIVGVRTGLIADR